MTHDQQLIALAEWDGWKRPDHPDVIKFKEGWDSSESWWMCPKGVLRLKKDIPNYLNDLNAVHELEGKLTDTQYVQWALALNELWLRDNPHPIPNRVGIFRSASAIAAQRCEALLKILNLWKP